MRGLIEPAARDEQQGEAGTDLLNGRITPSLSSFVLSSRLREVRGREECVTGDEPERRLLDVRPHAGQGGDFLNWRDGRFLMYELLDSLKTRLALPPIEFDRLLPEERVDVAIAPGDAGAASVFSRGGWPVLAGGGDLCSGGGSSVECAAP